MPFGSFWCNIFRYRNYYRASHDARLKNGFDTGDLCSIEGFLSSKAINLKRCSYIGTKIYIEFYLSNCPPKSIYQNIFFD